MGETLKLLEAALRKRGAPISSISQQAADLCGIIDHEITLFRYDRDHLVAENKLMKERLDRLERRISGTEPE